MLHRRPRRVRDFTLRTIFRHFWPDTRPVRRWLWLALLLVVAAPLLDTLGVWLFKVLVDDVLVPRDPQPFPALAAAFVGLTVLTAGVSMADRYLSTWMGERFLHDLRTRVYDHVQSLPSGFFDRRSLGDTLSRITSDVATIETLVLSGLTSAVSNGLKIGVYGVVLFVLQWQMALLALVTAPGFLIASRYFARRTKQISREQRKRAGAISAVAEEGLTNAVLVQAYNREAAQSARFRSESLGSFRAQMSATVWRGTLSGLMDLLEVIGVLLVVGFGVLQLTRDAITLGGLLVFLAYVSMLMSPVRRLGRLSQSVSAAAASAERLIELLDHRRAVPPPQRPVRLVRASGVVRFHHVTFGYPGARRFAAVNVSLEAHPGEIVALVGASGSGKSTLTRLLLRMHDPDRGTVTLDGHDLRALDLVDLRRNVAVVMQETLVVDASIRDNILWGRPDATPEEVLRAAAAADVDTFVSTLPDGYDTRVGQRGRLLSGGQRQRLAIARALVRDAPVLVLDEPTTGLDTDSTRRLMSPLRRLMAGRTTLLISHNLTLTEHADRIVVLNGGHIVETGTHDELLARDGSYAHLHRTADSAVPLQPVRP